MELSEQSGVRGSLSPVSNAVVMAVGHGSDELTEEVARLVLRQVQPSLTSQVPLGTHVICTGSIYRVSPTHSAHQQNMGCVNQRCACRAAFALKRMHSP